MSSRAAQFIEAEAEKDSETHSNRANDDDSEENDSDVPDEFEQDDFITYDQEEDKDSEEAGEDAAQDDNDAEDSAAVGQKRKRPHVPLPGPMWLGEEEEDTQPDRKKRRRLKKKKSALDEEEEETIVHRPKDSYRDDDVDDMSNFIVGQSREDIVEQGGNSLAANIFGEEHPMEMHDEGAYLDENDEFYGEDIVEDKYVRLKKLFPNEALKLKYMTEKDDEIRELDVPERIQLRQGVRTVTADELNREATWMLRQLYSHMFPVHNPQDDQYMELHSKVLYVLKQIHTEHCDIPYITQYLKEYWSDRLTEDDLWKIYEADDKFFRLQEKKAIVRKLYDSSSANVPQAYKDMLREATTMEEIKDLSQHFQLHYVSQNDMDIHSNDTSKKPVRRDQYTVAQKTPGFPELAKRMALSAHDYAHNLKSGIMLHFVEDPELMPEEMASTYTSRQFSTPGTVLKFVRHIHAFEIAKEPYVRSVVRRCYEHYAEISTELTPKGRTVGAFKGSTSSNLKNVSLQAFKASDEQHVELMRILQAKRDGLLKVEIRVPADQLDLALDPNANYHSDKTNDVAAAWNKQRTQIIEEVKQLLKKEMTEFVLDQYLKQGMSIVGKLCFIRLRELLMRGPFKAPASADGTKSSTPLTKHAVLACAPGRNDDEATSFVFLDANGEIQDTILWRFPPYMTHEIRTGNTSSSDQHNGRANPPKSQQQLDQEKELINKITKQKPTILAVGASGLNCRKIYRVIEDIQKRIPEETRVRTEFVRDDIARMYESSELAGQEFKELPGVVRRAISLGRYFNDPLSEIARLFNQDGDLLLMKIHPLQDMLRKSQLSRWVEQAFIRVVSQVGVDLNRVALHRHLQSTLQFVSGLGPRKADALIKHVVSRGELHTREDLKDAVDEHIFKNCAGFLRIQSTKSVEDEAAHFKPLDSTRVHPSSYQLAQKICLDALDADQDDEEEMDEQITSLMEMYDDDGNWVGAVPGSEEPDKLEDLDLDLYAQNLEDMGYGKKYITLRDIKEELKCPFKDPRRTYQSMTDEEVFYSATSESPEAFHKDSLVFLTISDVLRSSIFGYLDNGIRGRIMSMNLPSTNTKESLDQLYSVGQSLEAVVLSIDYIAFSTELSAKEEDLEGHRQLELDSLPRHTEDKKKKLVKRNITHPYFKNFDFKQAQEYLKDKPVGECVIRPSSKGLNHLALTYKWYGGAVVSVDIKEEKKNTPISLGEELWVKRQKFDDLDDLHYNLVELVMENAEQVVNHPKYVEASKEEIAQRLRQEKQRNPKIIPYCLGIYSKYPGRFFIYYLPGQQTVLYEPILVTAAGFEFLGKPYPSPTKLINHFKKHYRELPSLKRRQEAGARGANNTGGAYGMQDNRQQVFSTYSDAW